MPGKSREKPANMQRLTQLAQHKQPESVWITTVGRKLQWGDQESMWPLSKAALSAQPTPRLETLSQPKRDFEKEKTNPEFLYSCGRSSVIWGIPPGARTASATERLDALAHPKNLSSSFLEDRPYYVFSCGRSSPIWHSPKDTSESAPSSGRIEQLSRPKPLHSEYLPRRDVQTTIPRKALFAKASDRLDSLATPRAFPEGPFRDPVWQVKLYYGAETTTEDGEMPENIMYVPPNKRITELSTPRPPVENYRPLRSCIWDVTKSAKNAIATKRTRELSQPKFY